MTVDRNPDTSKAENIAKFLGELSGIIEDFSKAEKDKREPAGRFSPFRYISLDEEMSSCILADLLNPAGEHGQGRLFLDSFLELCEMEKDFFPKQADISVRCEDLTDSIANSLRRMDILIRSPKTALGIENKISAEDQPRQVLDYLTHLRKITRDDDKFRLVYLAPDGKKVSDDSWPPSERANFPTRSFWPVTWEELLKRFELCQEQVTSPKMRFFLEDFISAMRQKALNQRGDYDMTDLDELIFKMVFSKKENLVAALECARVFPLVMDRLLDKRKDKVNEALNENGLEQTFVCKNFIQILPQKKYWNDYIVPLACICNSGQNEEFHDYAIRFESSAIFFGKMRIGLRRPKAMPQRTDIENQVCTCFNDKFSIDKSPKMIDWAWWVWCVDLTYPWDNWNSAYVLQDLYGEALTPPEEYLIRLCKLFKEVLDNR